MKLFRVSLITLFILATASMYSQKTTPQEVKHEFGMGVIGGMGASGITFEFTNIYTYMDFTIPYKNPMSTNNPFSGSSNSSSHKSSFAFGIGPHIPIWNFAIVVGLDVYLYKSSYSLYGVEIKSDAKYKTELYYFGSLEYHFPKWYFGVGTGNGRGINASVGFYIK